jgi:hypothetical protein
LKSVFATRDEAKVKSLVESFQEAVAAAKQAIKDVAAVSTSTQEDKARVDAALVLEQKKLKVIQLALK